jgi:hypothetical protein
MTVAIADVSSTTMSKIKMQETEHTFRYSVNLVWNQDAIYRRYWRIPSVNTNKKLGRDLCFACKSCPLHDGTI